MAKLLNIGEISFVLYLYGVFHENMKGLTSINILSLFLFGRALGLMIIENRPMSDLNFLSDSQTIESLLSESLLRTSHFSSTKEHLLAPHHI